MNISICEAGAIFIKEVMCMTNYREIPRLDSIGLNKTEIAASCGCSRNTAAGALKRAAECGLSWPLPADMSDQQLAGILYTTTNYLIYAPFPKRSWCVFTVRSM